MKITLYPQVRDDAALSLTKNGSTITVNGSGLDFSPLLDGAVLPLGAISCPWVVGDVKRVEGILHIGLLFPIAFDASHAACFPEPISANEDGPIVLPE